ncbi:uncharacterized protein TNCT_107421 [Trichonephila clavata]|uniref:Uncharacterized protein n=1 Tax=Trichonephila clavata TaxID=2740835 RepID=A0A8X6HSP0_TRICU|nr:uncharacterized protein TNCT_255191 [Trichonephila clavata]GFR29249.1 uncharacterized protein TNCT_107421 [Trichonephila clavata]
MNTWIMILAIVLFQLFSPSLSENSYRGQRPLSAEYRIKNVPSNKNLQPEIRSQADIEKETIEHGVSYKFCNMFGCDCTPPPGEICCTGYQYDRRSNRCRKVFYK